MAFKHITLTFALLLAGCEESFTVEGICVQSPAMCNDLNHDSHLKYSQCELFYCLGF
ncbi:DUF2989 domain-containing protein [Pseudoalteromonas sp.]|uniref:DUF2989 domain-containing protein n=1 Tax=Pseudoalteromonas sp. TaxID=53249 RepID=UPI00356889A3